MRSAIGLVSSPVETDRVYRLRYGITLLDLGSPDRTTLRYWFWRPPMRIGVRLYIPCARSIPTAGQT